VSRSICATGKRVSASVIVGEEARRSQPVVVGGALKTIADYGVWLVPGTAIDALRVQPELALRGFSWVVFLMISS
jgi:hypothetical protein